MRAKVASRRRLRLSVETGIRREDTRNTWSNSLAHRGPAKPRRNMSLAVVPRGECEPDRYPRQNGASRCGPAQRSDVARLLIAHGADLDAKDWQGRTPLDLADAGDSAALAQAIREEISTRHARKVKTVHLTQAGTTTDAG